MRVLAGIVLVLALAPPAAAETVARRTPAVGPMLAGDSVMWGEQSRGALRVMMASPGRAPLLVHRVRPTTARRSQRSFMLIPAAFAASADAYAALMVTGTVTESGSDTETVTVTSGAFGGSLSAPPALLSGAIPRRGDPDCEGRLSVPEAVAVDGPRIAVGEEVGTCDVDPQPAVVTIHDGDQRTTIPVAGSRTIVHVELAGRYLAWIHEGSMDSLVVLDLETGERVVDVTQRDLRARRIEDAALGEDGTVAFMFGGLRGLRLGVLSPGAPGVRVLDRRVTSRGVAVAAGRVLYERVLGGPRFASELRLRPLAGGAARRLDRFDIGRERVGEIDLDAGRATWAVQPVFVGRNVLRPRGPARILVRGL